MIDYAEKLRIVKSLIYGKVTWLDGVREKKFRRPEHEIERVGHELTVLREIASDYERAVEISKAKGETT